MINGMKANMLLIDEIQHPNPKLQRDLNNIVRDGHARLEALRLLDGRARLEAMKLIQGYWEPPKPKPRFKLMTHLILGIPCPI